MALLAPMTKLEAVNKMLKSIGQAPVNTLEVSGISDVNKARQDLDETSRDIQVIGWFWNTDTNYTLTPDANNLIVLPDGTLDVDPMDKTSTVIMRHHPVAGMCLYDSVTQSYEFEEPIAVQIIWAVDFEELPQVARTYISIAAARRFQARVVSSQVLDSFNQEDEDRAWLLLQRGERRTRDTNLFRSNPTISRFFNRRRF